MTAGASVTLGWCYRTIWKSPEAWVSSLIFNLATTAIAVGFINYVLITVAESARNERDGNWASEVVFLPMIDVRVLVIQAARWLLADDPPGVEASEKWMPIAEELAKRRESMGALLSREILLAVVELESELRRVDFVTAAGDESRKAYAKDLLSLWRRYEHLMDKMLPPRDALRADLLKYPAELTTLQEKYNLTTHGNDRAEDEAVRSALRRR